MPEELVGSYRDQDQTVLFLGNVIANRCPTSEKKFFLTIMLVSK